MQFKLRHMLAWTFVTCVALTVLHRPVAVLFGDGPTARGFLCSVSYTLYVFGFVDKCGEDLVGRTHVDCFWGVMAGVVVQIGFWFSAALLTFFIFVTIHGGPDSSRKAQR